MNDIMIEIDSNKQMLNVFVVVVCLGFSPWLIFVIKCFFDYMEDLIKKRNDDV